MQSELFEKINALGLPLGEYVVVGGSVLAALGLIEWDDDIDLCVSPKVFDRFQDWTLDEWEGKPIRKHDVYDIGVEFGGWSLDRLLDDALIIRDIPFISLERLLLWKCRMNRAKDHYHIQVILSYLG